MQNLQDESKKDKLGRQKERAKAILLLKILGRHRKRRRTSL